MNRIVGDWVGIMVRRFNWRRLRFEWGRWHYETNCCGETVRRWFVANAGAKLEET